MTSRHLFAYQVSFPVLIICNHNRTWKNWNLWYHKGFWFMIIPGLLEVSMVLIQIPPPQYLVWPFEIWKAWTINKNPRFPPDSLISLRVAIITYWAYHLDRVVMVGVFAQYQKWRAARCCICESHRYCFVSQTEAGHFRESRNRVMLMSKRCRN